MGPENSSALQKCEKVRLKITMAIQEKIIINYNTKPMSPLYRNVYVVSIVCLAF